MIIQTKVIGIALVRNEDRFLRQAIINVAPICDRFILCDHMSHDGTWKICQDLAVQFPHLEIHQIEHTRLSHDFIKDYAGTPSWIFGVDGDELYEPKGLFRLREDLLSGRFDDYWNIKSNVLNCTRLDTSLLEASGHLAPPSRPITKLINFNAIISWTGCDRQYIHDGQITFKPGRSMQPTFEFGHHYSWEDSYFRCLHACFISRSSKDSSPTEMMTRLSPVEIKAKKLARSTGLFHRIIEPIKTLLQKPSKKDWKREWYARGDLVTKPVFEFFAQ